MGRLDNKVALITGASDGMGLAAAKLFEREGAKVIASSVGFEKLQNALQESENMMLLELDVRKHEHWTEGCKKAEERFGKIDILVNNAGRSIHKPLLEEDVNGWNEMILLNLTSIFFGTQTVIPYMQKNGSGSIVNCCSLVSLMASDNGAPAYCAAKGGVRSLTIHTAAAFAKDNIRCNAVFPGYTYTGVVKRYGDIPFEVFSGSFADVIPLPPHAGLPEDDAYVYLYLASDESKFVTGNEIVVDGGMRIV
jgi:NAD(P)-dependent dehydrogenase (short-subunit alcohol dehydrogenase family)